MEKTYHRAGLGEVRWTKGYGAIELEQVVRFAQVLLCS